MSSGAADHLRIFQQQLQLLRRSKLQALREWRV